MPRVADRDAVVRQYAAGWSTKAIAAHHGVEPPAVTRMLNRAGIKPERRNRLKGFVPLTEDDLRQLAQRIDRLHVVAAPDEPLPRVACRNCGVRGDLHAASGCRRFAL